MSNSPISLTAPGPRLAVPALPLVPGADLRFAPISNPENRSDSRDPLNSRSTAVQAHLRMGLDSPASTLVGPGRVSLDLAAAAPRGSGDSEDHSEPSGEAPAKTR